MSDALSAVVGFLGFHVDILKSWRCSYGGQTINTNKTFVKRMDSHLSKCQSAGVAKLLNGGVPELKMI